MTEIKTISGETTLRVAVRVEVSGLGHHLHAFRRTDTSVVVARTGRLRHGHDQPARSSEGVIDTANLQRMIAGEPFVTTKLVIFPDDLMEEIRTLGWHHPWRQVEAPSPNTGYDRVRRDVFTALSTGEASLANLVEPDFSNFVYFDYTGTPLPVGLSFNYMEGRFTDGNYDLEKAAAHLLTRPDITLAARTVDTPHSFIPWRDVAKNAQDAICKVPYYNAHDGQRFQIVFRWAPSAADYDRVVADIPRSRLGLSRLYYEAIERLDMFGLDAIGARRRPPPDAGI